MTDDDRAVLEMRLGRFVTELKRLEPESGGRVSPRDFAYWEGQETDPIRLRRAENGWYQFAEAVRLTRRALASDDPALVANALKHGNRYSEIGGGKAAAYEALTKRRKGGGQTASKSRLEAERRYRPYRDEYCQLLAAGVAYLAARQQVLDRMASDGVSVPSDRTVQKRFPKPTIISEAR